LSSGPGEAHLQSKDHRLSTPPKITRVCRETSSLSSSRLGGDSKRQPCQSLKSIMREVRPVKHQGCQFAVTPDAWLFCIGTDDGQIWPRPDQEWPEQPRQRIQDRKIMEGSHGIHWDLTWLRPFQRAGVLLPGRIVTIFSGYESHSSQRFPQKSRTCDIENALQLAARPTRPISH
jgi:hypothetical protein